MSNYDQSLEAFIFDPSTVALVLRSESITADFRNRYPQARIGKSLPSGFTIIYVGPFDIARVAADFANIVTDPYPMVFGLLGSADLDAAGILEVQQQPYLNLKGSGVLLGFVDTGIDYTQRAFRYEDGSSKIQYIWDQSIPGSPPDGFLYGTEYNNTRINEALSMDDPLTVVPHRDTVGHGTFLASIAGSRESGVYMGAAPDADIIAVKLKRARPSEYERYLIPPDQENAFASDDFAMALQYLLDKAAQLNRPLAVCISLGTNTGSHNGLNRVEEIVSRGIGGSGIIYCAAAGNEAQARHHTHGRLASTGETQNIELRAANQREDIYFEIWNNPSDRFSVSIRSPSGEQIQRIPARPGLTYQSSLILERASVRVEYWFPINRNGEQLTRIRIFSATPGIWTITVHGDIVFDGTYHAWLPLTGFIDPETVFLRPTPNFTIVTPAAAQGVIICGAYNSVTNLLYPSSSWGPTRVPSIAPDLVAPGVNVEGIFPYGYGTMSGTSVAAAMLTGACALMLQWGIIENNDVHLNSPRARTNLISGCSRQMNIDYPNNQWGYGRLNLMNTFRSLRPI